ncbi:MAG: 2-dehydropantoate 2-reductase [Vicinamibacteria bacterium]|nr:2-dehydropantoate 2-reductase [Vicinamibacteria bacterium]
MRVAIFGAGGVGAYFGGRLAEAGHELVVIARGAHLAAIRAEGLRVFSTSGDFTVKPALATDDPAQAGPVDLVLVGVKAWQVSEAAQAMQPLVGEATTVLPLQNGVEAPDQLAAELGAAAVLPGLCKIVSFIEAPGVVRHAGVEPRVEFGERDGRRSERVEALAAAFSAAKGVTVGVADDVEAALWEKFLFIAPVSGVGALCRQPIGVVRQVPQTRAFLLRALKEVDLLARARGVKLRDDAVARTLRFVDALPADSTASMQRDLAAGRPSELDNQAGAVVRLAAEQSLPVPAHEAIYAALLPGELKARGRL